MTVTCSAGIESRRARDSNAIVTVGCLRHVLALQPGIKKTVNHQYMRWGKGSAQGTGGRATAGEYCSTT